MTLDLEMVDSILGFHQIQAMANENAFHLKIVKMLERTLRGRSSSSVNVKLEKIESCTGKRLIPVENYVQNSM